MTAEQESTPAGVEGTPEGLLSPRFAGALVVVLAFWTLAVLPFRIVATGFSPTDDALRHAAKVVSGKQWQEVLVLRDDARADAHPGWHALLGLAHRAGLETPRSLVLFSVFALALLVLLPPLRWSGHPESWLLALLAVALFEPAAPHRWMLGRPYLVTTAVLITLAFLWPRLANERLPRRLFGGLVLLFTASAWMHGSSYLWLLAVGAFLLAGEARAGLRIAAAWGLGVLLGTLLSGEPVAFLVQSLAHPFWALGDAKLQRVLVTEFRPSSGNALMVLAVLALIAWRGLQGGRRRPLAGDPVFLLALGGWVLGLFVLRFWSDWGLSALLVWMTRELDDWLRETPPPAPRIRLRWALLLAVALFAAVTSDRQDRWTQSLGRQVLDAGDALQAPWLPEAGGVLYNDSMRTFYDTFYANPHAPWRYVLGFEAGMMRSEDRATLRRYQLSQRDDALLPWVAKMRPEDRLVLARRTARAPGIAELEWRRVLDAYWIGRLPRSQ
jgi:hypothetical protein